MATKINFSPSKLAFYDTSLKYKSVPTDVVAVTQTVFNKYSQPPPAGKILGASNNQPAWVAAPAPTLAEAQAAKGGEVYTAYLNANQTAVSFTNAAGTTKTYQADKTSVADLQSMITAYAGGVPSGFYWVAEDNTQVPMTLADLQGLAKAMGDQGWANFQKLQGLKAQIQAATTVSDVQAIAW